MDHELISRSHLSTYLVHWKEKKNPIKKVFFLFLEEEKKKLGQKIEIWLENMKAWQWCQSVPAFLSAAMAVETSTSTYHLSDSTNKKTKDAHQSNQWSIDTTVVVYSSPSDNSSLEIGEEADQTFHLPII